MAQPTEFPVNRWYNNNHTARKLEDGQGDATISFECANVEEWNSSANPVWEGDVPRLKTAEEVYTESIPSRIEALYSACMSYQLKNIDVNLDRVMDKADTIVAVTEAVETDYPLCKENGDWLRGLWVEYYTRKSLIEAMQPYSDDFSDYGSIPNDFIACDAEVNG